MALFDSVIGDIKEKLGLGDRAGGLLTVLLAMIVDGENGGFGGFLERFKEAGLGDLADSWVNAGANMPLSNEQTESVFGEGTLKEMADEVGLDYQTTTSATAFAVPHLVDKLTPNGEVPADSNLLSMIGSFASGGGADLIDAAPAGAEAGATVDRIGTAAVGAVDAGKESLGDGNSLLRIILPLIIIGILLVLGYMFCGKSNPTGKIKTNVSTNDNTNKAADKVTEANAKTVDSSFTLRAENGKYFVSGVVADEAIKKQITDALTAQYGAENVDFAGLRVDAGARPFGAGWWDNLVKLLPDLKDWKTGELSFSGNAVTAAAGLPAGALDRLKSLFAAGWRLPASIAGAETASKQANEEALKELAEAETAGQVVEALNISIINFASGKSEIPPDAQPVLQKAAEVLKAQPAATKIEIGGYTDSDGADDANLKLSEARANSVRDALVKLGVADAMLSAKGYGEADPVAPNDTPDNKFKNRRIEYKIVSDQP